MNTITSQPLFTLNEYLDKHRIDLSRSDKHKLAIEVARVYKSSYQEDPPSVYRANDNGKSIKVGKGYPLEFALVIGDLIKAL